MKLIKNMKLHNKLLVSYLVVCILPVILISQIIYRYSVSTIESTLMEMMGIYNSQVISNLDNFIKEYDDITKAILVDQEIINQGNLGPNPSISARITNKLYINKILIRLETIKPEIDRIILFTSGGELFQYGKSNDSIDISLLEKQDWFKNLISSRKTLSVTELHDTSYYLQDKNRTIISIGRTILDSGSNYAGLILIDLNSINLIDLNSEFVKARDKYNIKLIITNKSKNTIYHSDMISGEIPLKDFIENTYTKYDYDDFIIMSGNSKYGDLTVQMLISRSDLLFNINKVQYITLIVTLLCSLGAIFVSIIFSYSITKPIKNLKTSMKLVEEGKYLVIKENYFNDEMNALVKSYNEMIGKTKSLIEEVYLSEIKQKNAKLLALQTQINPHMLYNTFESIRMQAIINNDEETANMIKILSRLFRSSLGKNIEKNTIQNELDYLEDYITLQNIRFDGRFKLKILVSDEIRSSNIIALILQPLVENSIKHGLVLNSPLEITISGELFNKNIILTIYDNGVGINKEKIKTLNEKLSNHENIIKSFEDTKIEQVESIGLKNIAERIYLYYGLEYYIKIVPETEKGTKIEIMLPNYNSESDGEKNV